MFTLMVDIKFDPSLALPADGIGDFILKWERIQLGKQRDIHFCSDASTLPATPSMSGTSCWSMLRVWHSAIQKALINRVPALE